MREQVLGTDEGAIRQVAQGSPPVRWLFRLGQIV